MKDLTDRIHHAAREGDPDHLASALEAWPVAYIHARDADGNTPLHTAASAARSDIVRLLLSHGAHPLARNNERATPLHLAALANAGNVVDVLLANGADPEMQSKRGNCLAIAVRKGLSDLTDVFLTGHSWERQDLWSAMGNALLQGHFGIAAKFEKHGLDLQAKTAGGMSFLGISVSDDAYIDTTRYLLKSGARVDDRDSRLATPLHMAAFNAGPLTVAELLAAGADPNAEDGIGGTPLFAALQESKLSSVRHLLRAGADATRVVRLRHMRRPLIHVASQDGSCAADMAKLLVEYGADPNARDESGALPAKWAAESGHTDLLRYFHRLGCDLTAGDDQKSTPLLSASLNGHIDCVRFLVEIGADINAHTEDGHTALIAATQNGHLEIVSFLLENGARSLSGALNQAFWKRNPDAVRIILQYDPRPFRHQYEQQTYESQVLEHVETAVSESKLSLARELLRGVADLKALSEPARSELLVSGAANGAAEVVRRLVEAGASRDSHDKVSLMTPIHGAAEGGHLQIINMLIEAGFPVASETQFGQTALHFAASSGNPAIIRRLGGLIRPGIKDINGYLPLHWAAIKGHASCIEPLVDVGSQVDPVDDGWRTPLHWAAEGGFADCVQALLDCGANARALDRRERSCLHLAALGDKVDALQRLLPQVAEMVNARDSLGFTALQYTHGRTATELLLQHGANGHVGNDKLGMFTLEVFAMRGNATLVEKLLDASPEVVDSKLVLDKLFIANREEPGHEVFDYLVKLQPALQALDDVGLASLLQECVIRADEHRILSLLTALYDLGRAPSPDIARQVLMIACKQGFLGTARLLAAIPGVCDGQVRGWQPLLVACNHGHLATVESLLECGADPSAKDARGQDAEDIAAAAGHDDIVEILKQYLRFQSEKSKLPDLGQLSVAA